MDRRVSGLGQNITIYPSVDAFSALVARLDATSYPGMHLQATVLAELCAAVSRDLGYLERLLGDVKSTLGAAASYHTPWANDVRKAARRSLDKVDLYMAAKIPSTLQPQFNPQDVTPPAAKSKLSDAVKDVTSVAALQQLLMAAHAGLLSALGLAHQLVFRHDGAAEDLQGGAVQ